MPNYDIFCYLSMNSMEKQMLSTALVKLRHKTTFMMFQGRRFAKIRSNATHCYFWFYPNNSIR